MEKNVLKKRSKVWKCPKKCQISDRPCKHLEALLPSMGQGKLSESKTEEYDDSVSIAVDSYEDTPEFYQKIEQKLGEQGLRNYEIDLIMDRFISKLTLKEIAKKHGYLSTYTVKELLIKLTKVLRFMEGSRNGQ